LIARTYQHQCHQADEQCEWASRVSDEFKVYLTEVVRGIPSRIGSNKASKKLCAWVLSRTSADPQAEPVWRRSQSNGRRMLAVECQVLQI
jgi:hypothetical protein